ncbi:MAG: hypothetical protein ACOC0Y_00495 [Spirochaetota bacterium]
MRCGPGGPIATGPPTMTVSAAEKDGAIEELEARGCVVLSVDSVHPGSTDWVIQYECDSDNS